MQQQLSNLNIIENALEQSQRALNSLIADKDSLQKIAKAGEALATLLKDGGRIYSCGNGGSMSDAMHFAEELSGRFRENRRPFAAMAISDPSHLSCVANDFGYDEVFSRFVAAHGRPGDGLLAISTSGKSPNVLKAVKEAKERKMLVIGLCADQSTPLAELADVAICTPGFTKYSDRVQELHIKVIHILIEVIENQLLHP